MNKALSKSSCGRCDIGYLIQDHITPLMQLLTNDMPQLNFRLQTTKCLNTAVMILFFMLGQQALQIAQTCDTNKVISRHKQGIDNNLNILQDLKRQLLSRKEKTRTLYYILLTDGYFPKTDTKEARTGKDNVYFPGHVFILEKLYDESKKEHFFYFYQSYINQYTLKGHVQKNKGLIISKKRALELYEDVAHVLTADKWDEKSMAKWFDLTFASTPQFADSRSRQNFFICFRKAKTNTCLKNITTYLQKKLRELNTIQDSDSIYGDTSLYLDKSIALSTGELRIEVQSLLNKIKSNIQITNSQ